MAKNKDNFSDTIKKICTFLDGLNKSIKINDSESSLTKRVYFLQHHSSMIRNAEKDREHPVDRVIINTFNEKTGSNLDEVKMVYGPGANEYTRRHHTLAFAVAAKIFFRDGAYKPETEEGRALIAHELTHVKQFKEKGLVDNTTREEKEAEAEYYEKQEAYKPEKEIKCKIGGKEYSFTKAQWKMIRSKVEEGVEEWVERQERAMSGEQYLKLLYNYLDWKEEWKHKWP